jgi:hypothetical protein
MRTDRRLRPSVERVESKALLSAGMTSPSFLAAAHAVAARPTDVLKLTGTASGRWSTSVGIPDIGRSTSLVGKGTIAPLGAVNVSGSLHAPGFIARGRATGSLVLTGANGSVALQLTGPLQRGFSALPTSFTYRIVGGTGAYVGSTGRGKAEIHLLEADAVPTRSASTSPAIIVGPIFTLTLK